MVNPNQSTVFLSFLLRTWPGNKHNLPDLYGITLFQLRISTSKPGCKAFDYVKKNGFLRFLQKQGTKMGWIGSSRWAQYIGDSGMKLKNWYSCQSFLIFRLLQYIIDILVRIYDICMHIDISCLLNLNFCFGPLRVLRRTIPVGSNKAGCKSMALLANFGKSQRHHAQVPVADILSPGFQAVLVVMGSEWHFTAP